MAFPAHNQSLADALAVLLREASRLRALAVNARDRMAAGNVGASLPLSLLESVRAATKEFDRISAIPGIVAYAQEQLGADIGSDFSAMNTAAKTVGAEIIAALPKDANGYLLLETIDAQGQRLPRQFTPQQTAGLRASLDALIATIE